MKIPSFSPKITPAVVGFTPSSSYHLGFVCVCVCVCMRAGMIPPPHNLASTDTLLPSLPYSHIHATRDVERTSDRLKRPDFCLPVQRFLNVLHACLKNKTERKNGGGGDGD